MLLVLSTPHDDTARRFAAHAGRCGYPVWGPWNGGALDVCAQAGRDGGATSEIWCRRTGTRVRSILNRGYCPGADAGAFSEAESLASWWSALALFPGPVVNRPSRRGYVPVVDVPSLTGDVAGLEPARITYGVRPPCPPASGRLNVHRARDGQWIGGLTAPMALDPTEVYTFTEFDPSQTVHVLWAGRRLFDLGRADGMPSVELERQLSALSRRLDDDDVAFAFGVLERPGPSLRLVHASAFPSVDQYKAVEAEVHDALLEYLTT